jgi:methionyl aminopeptidase
MFTRIKTKQEQAAMRESGRMLATILQLMKQSVGPDMTTDELDALAQKELKALGGKPAFLGYQGFPKAICISMNEEIVHGIPGDRIIKDGDLISFDFGVNYQGMITDAAFTMLIGKDDDPAIKRLLEVTERSLYDGVDVMRHGVKTGDIGAAIGAVLKAGDLGIVRDLVGHGVGHQVHEEPNIPNYGTAGRGTQLSAGMTVAIEPMATLGGHQVILYTDGWTVATADQSLSAHYEHTILITDTGAEILTVL